MLQVATPDGSREILLHSCCAPCSGAIIECLVRNGIRPTVFFSNSNITPREEYEHRKAEIVRYAESFGLEVVDDDYDHEAWLDCALARRDGVPEKALAEAPERGARCTECFKFRLLRAARYAKEHGFTVLATTLASSRWKDLDQVNAAGMDACGRVDPCKTVAARGLVNGGDPTVRLGGMSAQREVLRARPVRRGKSIEFLKDTPIDLDGAGRIAADRGEIVEVALNHTSCRPSSEACCRMKASASSKLFPMTPSRMASLTISLSCPICAHGGMPYTFIT